MRTIRIISLLAATLLMLAACGNDDETTTATTTSEPTTTSEATTTTAGPSDEGIPDEIVAITANGHAVVLDATDGDEVRTLLTDMPVEPASNDVAVTPDGETAYIARPGQGTAPTEIVAVPTAGGEPEVVTEGFAPSVSPDGSTLAYVGLEPVEGPQPPVPAIVLRDLETGEERRLARNQEPEFTYIADTAWALDGATLAFVAGEIHTGLYALDTVAAADLDASRRLGPTARSGDRGEASWRAVTPLDEDRLAVVETCCDVGERERWLVLAVNIAQAEAEGGILPTERTEASRLDADPGADAILLVTDVTPEGGTLLTWPGQGEPNRVSSGVIAAAW